MPEDNDFDEEENNLLGKILSDPVLLGTFIEYVQNAKDILGVKIKTAMKLVLRFFMGLGGR